MSTPPPSPPLVTLLSPVVAFIYANDNQGELFRNYLRCYPLSSDEPGQISHIVGMLTEIPTENEEPQGMRMSAVEAF